MLGLLTQWGEYCDAVAAGRAASTRRREPGEHLALFPVWHPESFALAFIDPVTEHVSVLGEGALPKLLMLERMARHAYGAGVGDTLFPPLSVRLDGKEVRFRWAGSGSILAFVARGSAPPTRADPVVVLALLGSGYNLVGLKGDRALLIVQGRQRELDGIDLDRLLIWARLREQVEPFARIERPSAGSVGCRMNRAINEREHFGALLRVALLAVVDDLPTGARGRRDAVPFLDDIARLVVLGAPDIRGSSKQVAMAVARALGQEPRDSRTTNAILSLLHQHGVRHAEVIVSKESGQRWWVHLESLADLDSRTFKALLSRRPVLRSIYERSDEPETRAESLEHLSAARRKALSWGQQAPLLLGTALSSEWDQRQQREAELREIRATHVEELNLLRATIDMLTESLGEVNARKATLAAELAKSDTRIDQLQRHAETLIQQLAEFAAEGAVLGSDALPPVLEKNKELVRSFVAAVARRDHTRVEGLMAPGFIGHGFALGVLVVRAREDLMNALKHNADEVLSASAQVGSLVAEDDKVAARSTWRIGEQDFVHVHLYRVEDGRIAEAWGENTGVHAAAANSRPC